MNKLLVIMGLLFSLQVTAAPYVVGDVLDLSADLCIHKFNSGAEVSTPVVVDPVRGNPANGHRICFVDAANVPTGNNIVEVKIRNSIWGPQYDSPFALLAFVRPGAPMAPVNGLRLVQ